MADFFLLGGKVVPLPDDVTIKVKIGVIIGLPWLRLMNWEEGNKSDLTIELMSGLATLERDVDIFSSFAMEEFFSF